MPEATPARPYLDPVVQMPRARTLDRMQVESTLASSLRYDVEQDYMRDQLLHRLTGYVLSERVQSLSQTVTFDAPASTWQTWKNNGRTRFHRWLRRHRPVRMVQVSQTVTFTRDATYPLANLSLPDLGPVVFHERIETTPRGSDPLLLDSKQAPNSAPPRGDYVDE